METKETRVCKNCGRELPIEKFKLTRYGTRVYVCTECSTAKLRANKMAQVRNLQQEYERKESETRMLRIKDFTPREWMEELARRGYRGKLTFVETHTIDIENF